MGSVSEQAFIFLASLMGGAALGLLFDFFRAFRKSFKQGVFLIGAEDIVFWLISTVFIFLLLYFVNGGELRGYIFGGLFLGGICYRKAFKNTIVNLLIHIGRLINRILFFAVKLLVTPFFFLARILRKPFFIVISPIKRAAKSVKVLWTRTKTNGRKIKKKLSMR